MKIVALDMGMKNFAMAQMEMEIEDADEKKKQPCWGNVRFMDVHDLSLDGGESMRSLIVYMDKQHKVWECTDLILIEQQLNRHNIIATRLACHTAAYFYHRYPDLPVMEYPATYKTRYLDAPRSLDHKGRKKFAIEAVLNHYREEDPVLMDWLASCGAKKLDDICDCILMCATMPCSPLYDKIKVQKKNIDYE
jgi:hypothetical protein